MATSASTSLTLGILMVAGSLIYNTNVVSAQCGGSIPALISQCQKFVQKTGPTIPPSPGCCTVLKSFDVRCACKLVPEDIDKYVSVQKALFVAKSCGLKLIPGLKCGPIILPPTA